MNGERLRVTIDWPQIDRDEITKEHGVAQVLAAAILWAAEAAEVHPDEMLEAVTTRMSELEYCGKPQ